MLYVSMVPLHRVVGGKGFFKAGDGESCPGAGSGSLS